MGQVIDFGLSKDLLGNEVFRILVVDWFNLGNLAVHRGLCKCRLVLFIVSVPPVPDKVNENILFEDLSILHCHFENSIHQIRFISVHMYYRSSHGFGQISAVETCPCFDRSSRESDLVIHNHMNYSLRGVPVKVLHLQTFINDTLACQRRVTVDHQAKVVVT